MNRTSASGNTRAFPARLTNQGMHMEGTMGVFGPIRLSCPRAAAQSAGAFLLALQFGMPSWLSASNVAWSGQPIASQRLMSASRHRIDLATRIAAGSSPRDLRDHTWRRDTRRTSATCRSVKSISDLPGNRLFLGQHGVAPYPRRIVHVLVNAHALNTYEQRSQTCYR